MEKLFTFLMLMCSVMVWGQNDEGKELLRKAESGDAKAQVKVGAYYYLGYLNFPKDYKEAFKWYQKAASQGDPEGLRGLGNCYIEGIGVVKNEEEGVRLYKKAADLGDISSMLQLGQYYEDYNKDEAIYWYKKDMDTYFAKTGEEDYLPAEKLRELGVNYHPGQKSSNSNSSHHHSDYSEYSSSSQGDYISTQIARHIRAFESSRKTIQDVNKVYEEVKKIAKAHKDEITNPDYCFELYKFFTQIGNIYTQLSTTNVNLYDLSYLSYIGPSADAVYIATEFLIKAANNGHAEAKAIYQAKANQMMPNNNNYNNNYNIGGGSGGYQTNRVQKICQSCKGTGKCGACHGTGRFLNGYTGDYIICSQCSERNGRICSVCNGTGRW